MAPRGREVTFRELELRQHREHALAHQMVTCRNGIRERLLPMRARLGLTSQLRARGQPPKSAVRLALHVADLREDRFDLAADALDGREIAATMRDAIEAQEKAEPRRLVTALLGALELAIQELLRAIDVADVRERQPDLPARSGVERKLIDEPVLQFERAGDQFVVHAAAANELRVRPVCKRERKGGVVVAALGQLQCRRHLGIGTAVVAGREAHLGELEMRTCPRDVVRRLGRRALS